MRSIHTCDDLGVCNGRHCHDVSRCEVPCSPEPRYPFAPGVIDGFPPPKDNAWLRSAPAVVALVLLLALLGSLAGCWIAEYVVWPTWLLMGLPG